MNVCIHAQEDSNKAVGLVVCVLISRLIKTMFDAPNLKSIKACIILYNRNDISVG
jgi:hypothetical protein